MSDFTAWKFGALAVIAAIGLVLHLANPGGRWNGAILLALGVGILAGWLVFG